MKVEVAKYRKPDGYATRYWSVNHLVTLDFTHARVAGVNAAAV